MTYASCMQLLKRSRGFETVCQTRVGARLSAAELLVALWLRLGFLLLMMNTCVTCMYRTI